jgi:hypothetical protein
MSRAQSFMSMAAWPKSKPNKVDILRSRNDEKGRKGTKRDEKGRKDNDRSSLGEIGEG